MRASRGEIKIEEILKEELNIKNIEILSSVSDIATMKRDPNFNAIREKYPTEVGQIIKAVKSGKYEMKGDVVECNVDGVIKTYDKEIILITYLAKDGLFVASEHDLIVSLDLTITNALKEEGEARDIIRAIQDARKQLNCEITDRVKISIRDYESSWLSTICEETLSDLTALDVIDLSIEVNLDDKIIIVDIQK